MRQTSPDPDRMKSPYPGTGLKPPPPGSDGLRTLMLDGLLLASGLGLNFWVWLGFIRLGHIPPEYVSLLAWIVVPLVALRLGLLWVGGLYRTLSPHLGYHELTVIAAANTGATAGLILFNLLTPAIDSIGAFPLDSAGEHLLRVPWGIVFNDWMISLIVLGGIRFLRHEVDARAIRASATASRATLIVGTGKVAAHVARDLADQTHGRFLPIGFVDPEGANIGAKIHGMEILGDITTIPDIAERSGASEIVIALDHASPSIVRDVVAQLATRNLNLKMVPDLDSLVSGHIQMEALRPVEIEDLLGRSAVRLNEGTMHKGLKGKRILITGAGGSIGRELTHQAMASGPASLTLVELGENNLFDLMEEITTDGRHQGLDLHTEVGDITQRPFVERLFASIRPEIVFHAAAHKHVHLMEQQPAEAIRNNVGGTLCIAEAAARHGVARLVNISTDKAVNPVGVMGQTKRVGELIVSSIAAESSLPFASVRFGNVLGSRGSVLPTFRRQIEQGGPVTVTDPEATRYFMTVDEAVSLLIEAGTTESAGSVLILNMGRPVKIAELARNIIRLSGYEPDRDISIEYIGLRPGERLHEVLIAREEVAEADKAKPVWVARETPPAWDELKHAVHALLEAADQSNDEKARMHLVQLIEKYGGSTRTGMGETDSLGETISTVVSVRAEPSEFK